MGIQGLLPLLKDIQTHTHVREYKGKTLGIDAYVWLHRGAYACAQELALGQPTDRFIRYAMNKINMLRHFGVTPYLVFDGGKLPSKERTEDDRERRRTESREKAEECLAAGDKDQARDLFAKCVDISPAIAYQLIKALRREKVSYIVAPYEADAQLAYLEKEGIIDGIITEDSDMLVFGCQRVLFKLESDGSCIEILQSRFTANRSVSFVGWTIKEFRHMSILSGCDYLDSIVGMGLKNAHRLLRRYKTVEKVLQAVRLEGKLRVPPSYARDFRRAELTFMHQRVIDPRSLVLTTLAPIPAGVDESAMDFIGPAIPAQYVAGIANGNVDPITLTPIVDIMPGPSQGSSAVPQMAANAPFSSAARKSKTEDPRQRSLDSWYNKTGSTPSHGQRNGPFSLSAALDSATQPLKARSAHPLQPKDVNRRHSPPQARSSKPGSQFILRSRTEAFLTQQPETLVRRINDKGKGKEVDTSGVKTTSRYFQLNGGPSPEAMGRSRKLADEDMDLLETVSSAAGSSPTKGPDAGHEQHRTNDRMPALRNFLYEESIPESDERSPSGSRRGSQKRKRADADREDEEVDEPGSSQPVRRSPRTVIREAQEARGQGHGRLKSGLSPTSNITSSPATSPIGGELDWEEVISPTVQRTRNLHGFGEAPNDHIQSPVSMDGGQEKIVLYEDGEDGDDTLDAGPAVDFSRLDRSASFQFGKASPHESQLGDDWASQVLFTATQETEALSDPSQGSRRSASPLARMRCPLSTFAFQAADDSRQKRSAAGFKQGEDEDLTVGLSYVVKDDRAVPGQFGELDFTSQQVRTPGAGRSSMAAPQLRGVGISQAVHRSTSGLSLRALGEQARWQEHQQKHHASRSSAAASMHAGAIASEAKRTRLSLNPLETPRAGTSTHGRRKEAGGSVTRMPLLPLNLSVFKHDAK